MLCFCECLFNIYILSSYVNDSFSSKLTMASSDFLMFWIKSSCSSRFTQYVVMIILVLDLKRNRTSIACFQSTRSEVFCSKSPMIFSKMTTRFFFVLNRCFKCVYLLLQICKVHNHCRRNMMLSGGL